MPPVAPSIDGWVAPRSVSCADRREGAAHTCLLRHHRHRRRRAAVAAWLAPEPRRTRAEPAPDRRRANTPFWVSREGRFSGKWRRDGRPAARRHAAAAVPRCCLCFPRADACSRQRLVSPEAYRVPRVVPCRCWCSWLVLGVPGENNRILQRQICCQSRIPAEFSGDCRHALATHAGEMLCE